MNRTALRVSFALAVFALAPAARASDPFPDTIKMQLNLSEAPPCTYCHQTLIGGLMTVTKPFGRTVQKYGVHLQDVAALRNAIMQMQVNGDDSDGDGVGDIAELLQGTDPNVAGEGGIEADEARYGCFCSTPPARSAPSVVGAAGLAGLALSGFGRRALRRRRVERKT
ncbi:MAG TPA: hypothetical protein VK550_25700 [Polyangiaceae bacterium]|nr:hypothetical protein [Polyangiaceae bacterium]